jgi:PAS domain-containing protein
MPSTVTRHELSASAHDRLRRYALLGVTITGVVTATFSGAIIISDGAIDLGMVALFAPDIAIGFVIAWQVFVLKRFEAAVHTYLAYLAIEYGFVALQADGFEALISGGTLLPAVLGFYLGGRRLGLVMTALMAVEAVVAAVVHATGIGHHLIEMPPMTDTGTQIMMALGTAEVLGLIVIFELRRDRTRLELDVALGELDSQSQTMVALVESTRDVIVLVDDRHRVVLHNRAASETLPGIAVGASAPAVVAGETAAAWTGWLDECARAGHARAEHTLAGQVFELSFSRVVTGERLIGFVLIARDITARRDAEAALRKMRGQLLEVSRRAGIAETTAALLHGVGNALNGATVSSGVIDDRASGLRVDNLRRAVDEIDNGALARGDERATMLRAYLRAIVDDLATRKATLIRESRSLRASLDEVTVALSEKKPSTAPQVLDELSLDDIVASALSADDCRISRSIAPTGTIVSDRHRVIEIVASLFSVCRGDGMHDALQPMGDVVALSISPAQRTPLGTTVFAHGKPLHAAALAASALGGSLRRDDARDRESFVLELPRMAPGHRELRSPRESAAHDSVR